MIPEFVELPGGLWPVLPPGIHDSDLQEVYKRYAINFKRELLYKGLAKGLENLFNSGCPQVFLDGSFITAKPLPNDYEICWDMSFVNPTALDPVFLDFSDKRFQQMQKFQGEYFPASWVEGMSGKPFLDFFQVDKETGKQKGIIRLINYIKKGGLI